MVTTSCGQATGICELHSRLRTSKDNRKAGRGNQPVHYAQLHRGLFGFGLTACTDRPLRLANRVLCKPRWSGGATPVELSPESAEEKLRAPGSQAQVRQAGVASGFLGWLRLAGLDGRPGAQSVLLFPVSARGQSESVDAHQRSFDVGIHIGYQRRNKDVLAWVKKRRRTIRREDLISFLCGKAPPPRNSRPPPRLTVVSPNRATSTESSSSVETDLQPFREAIALHGLSGAMASISVRSSTPGSPTHVSSGSNGSRRRNGLHDVDLNTFISEEMALHLDNGGTRKRTSAQCGDGITDSPTHKRNRMI
ncbi:UPF0472 protein C16orf72 homolog [Python bivittatus]|uniref:UPF0472 protein C16orf72 homolog n=1 Tax=Python bivittatus TaxID=176946 RepID=A0A9F5IT49_PYTBI|nr:UPF0472 protein C16orf72 homolog [Python bivittatus]